MDALCQAPAFTINGEGLPSNQMISNSGNTIEVDQDPPDFVGSYGSLAARE